MKKRYFYIILFIASIIGLAVVQYQYLRIGLNLAKVQFESKIEKTSTVIKSGLEVDNKLTYLVRNAIEKDTSFFKVSADSLEKVANHFLRDFIEEQLFNQGIESEFEYNLQIKGTEYALNSPSLPKTTEDLDHYPILLEGYFKETFDAPIVLELYFQNLNNYFLAKLNGLTLPSILFLLGICATIIWVLRTYYWQSNIITTTNEFINNLTHELKTPVFSIGLATKLLDETASQKQKPVLSIVRQQVERLSTHIDKVLQLASLESGKAVMELVPVDFKPNLESICSNFKTLVSIENAQFGYEIKGESFLLNAEVFHLENAINNILDNAKKYAEDPIIKLKAHTENCKLFIEVTDNGRGMSSEERKNVFKKFYRGTNGNLHTVKGHGLGMSYVYKVIKRHKGKVLVDSERGQGAKVTVVIPILE
ncbi:HAMP domain-containing sensor histidine kinase [Cytophaga sp. FL35]|uniref:sensor histidine kinase n=1 Tax=Cytophaga sp. FL35 TaxID=1904456 RepID=UPI001653DCBB|nr:HAMP domain-containing sensor histidine kinase [Cytophaga sp. FL35]MBC6999531.1 HAMP domain-containing histidine kinase [Cytophaga sp. FL35]